MFRRESRLGQTDDESRVSYVGHMRASGASGTKTDTTGGFQTALHHMSETFTLQTFYPDTAVHYKPLISATAYPGI